MQLSMDIFRENIRKARSRESSGDSESRSNQNPSYGQCLVTALLAHEFLGLSIYAEKITNHVNRTGYHFFNKDAANIAIRFCEEQFAHEKVLTRKKEKLLRKEQIDFLGERNPDIQQRYAILKQRFQSEIEKVIR